MSFSQQAIFILFHKDVLKKTAACQSCMQQVKLLFTLKLWDLQLRRADI